MVPNQHYNAACIEQLRASPTYQPLPPVDQIAVSGSLAATHRYVRQDSALWRQLHDGVLTTGCLMGALGFCEPIAARHLGLSRPLISHQSVLSAYNRLILPQLETPELNMSSQGAVHFNEQLIAQQINATAAVPASPAAVASVSRRAAEGGPSSVRCTWGGVQEPSALYAAAQLFPSSTMLEVGLCRLDVSSLPSAWGFTSADLPPIGASPDGLLRHPPLPPPGHSPARSGGPALLAGTHTLQDVEAALASVRLQPTARAGRGPPLDAGSACPDSSAAASPSGSVPPNAEWVFEVVEVKNHCPFTARKRVTRKGRPRLVWGLNDWGPLDRVPPQYMPQLQMEMLAAGCATALFVSRSATRGLNVMRIARSDEWLRLSLTVLSRFYRAHVLPRVPPPVNVFHSLREHRKLIELTKALCAESRVNAHVSTPAALPIHASRKQLFV